jgi:hypothetical protein
MKSWFCDNCFKRSESDDKVMFKDCPCGSIMYETIGKKELRKGDNHGRE